MRIGELGRATGVDIETIRYYEKQGLLPLPARAANGYRAYGSAHLERLAFIRHCRALEMSLAEIKRLLDLVAHPEADCGDINRLIDGQLARVQARLKSMRALEKQLAALRGGACSRRVRHPARTRGGGSRRGVCMPSIGDQATGGDSSKAHETMTERY